MSELEKALEAAHKLFFEESGVPEDMWHPDFGWVLINGEPTENTKEFLEYLDKHDNK